MSFVLLFRRLVFFVGVLFVFAFHFYMPRFYMFYARTDNANQKLGNIVPCRPYLINIATLPPPLADIL